MGGEKEELRKNGFPPRRERKRKWPQKAAQKSENRKEEWEFQPRVRNPVGKPFKGLGKSILLIERSKGSEIKYPEYC